MAWIQVANRKINTALITFVEEVGTDVRIWFSGQVEPLDLHFDEARAIWKALKADDTMLAKQPTFQSVIKTAGGASASSGDVFDMKADDPDAPKALRPVVPPSPGRSSRGT